MEGLLVYNGKGNNEEWLKVYFRTREYFYDTFSTKVSPANASMADSSKPYFKVGGPKLLIKW